jgi:hypothetical protein
MNAKAYYWLGVSSAFAIGVITGVAGVRVDLERKLRKEYAEREEIMQSAYEKALEMGLADKEQPEEEVKLDENLDQAIEGLGEIELLEISLDKTPNAFGEGILTVGGDIVQEGEPSEEKVNPYHKAVEATTTSHELFVDGGVNDYGVSYIEEEDYQDEDGRVKYKIDILMDDQNPVFLMDGQPINDWAERVGDSILVDFYKLVPPGVEPILYVRNHKTDEDYEVVQVTP